MFKLTFAEVKICYSDPMMETQSPPIFDPILENSTENWEHFRYSGKYVAKKLIREKLDPIHISLLDNAPNYLFGCVIQKRYTYIDYCF